MKHEAESRTPREGGILAGFDEQELRDRMTDPAYAPLWQTIVAKWEGIAARWVEEGEPLQQGGFVWPSITPLVVEAALIHRLTGRSDALQYVEKCIRHLNAQYGGNTAAPDKSGETYLMSHGEIALAADLCRDKLSQETHKIWCRLVREIAIPCADFDPSLSGYGAGGNIPYTRNTQAGIVALLWGAEVDYPDWETVVDRSVEVARQYIRHGCDRGGFFYEGSGYGGFLMLYLSEFAVLLKQCGWCDLFELEPVLEKLADANIQMLLSDFSFSATTNDLGYRSPNSLWWLHVTAREYNRPEHRSAWQAFQGPDHPIRPWGDFWPGLARILGEDERTNGACDRTLMYTFLHWDAAAPVIPLTESTMPLGFCTTGSGTASFRSSWSRNSIFACLLGAGRDRASHGHAHADCGHFGISIGSEYLAIDTGRYNTNEDQHSIVLIDGKNRYPSSREGGGMDRDRRSGKLKNYEQTDYLDHCTADATHMKDCVWALRDFFFVRVDAENAYIIMLDNINFDGGQQPHEYWWQMQVSPDAAIEIKDDGTAAVLGKQNRLDCSFFQKRQEDVAADKAPNQINLEEDIQEWVWPYGREQVDKAAEFELLGLQITSVRRPRLLAKQKSNSCTLLSVVVPRRLEQPLLSIQQFGVTNGIGVEVIAPTFCDRFYAAPDHAFIEAEDGTRGFAEFAMQRNGNGGQVLASWTTPGSDLSFGKIQ